MTVKLDSADNEVFYNGKLKLGYFLDEFEASMASIQRSIIQFKITQSNYQDGFKLIWEFPPLLASVTYTYKRDTNIVTVSISGQNNNRAATRKLLEGFLQ